MSLPRSWVLPARVWVLVAPLLLTTLAAMPAPAQAAYPGKPAVVEVRTIGTSVQGRPIVAWRLGDPTSTKKVVIMAGMHGDEPGPSRILYRLRDGRPIRGADIWVIPDYNPDGRVRHTRQNARGVDLNRNWPRNWAHLTGATDSGSGPASEPETKAVMAFLQEVQPRWIISFHQPLRGIGRAGDKGRALVQRLHRGLRLPVKSFNCDGVCHGTMTEWYNATYPGVAVTVEYGRGLSRHQARTTGPTGLLHAVDALR